MAFRRDGDLARRIETATGGEGGPVNVKKIIAVRRERIATEAIKAKTREEQANAESRITDLYNSLIEGSALKNFDAGVFKSSNFIILLGALGIVTIFLFSKPRGKK